MSRRPELLARLRRRDDDGFSLVEILVSITILGIVAAAVLPLLLSSIRAGTLVKLNTQAKGLAQERLERMRNLPFHLAHASGDYIDVLDVYFKDLANPGTVGTGDACASRRYEAATRSSICTIASQMVGNARFDQQIATRFITLAGATVIPRADYDSQVTNRDTPMSRLLDVVITTTWTQADKSKSYRLQSRIAASATDEGAIRSRMKVSALRITAGSGTSDILSFEAGLVSAEGSKATATSASATAVGAVAGLQSGVSLPGANVTLSAPVDDIRTGLAPVGPRALDVTPLECLRVCFGQTRVTGETSAVTSGGVPTVGVTSAGSGLEAELSRTGSGPDRGFQFNNATLSEVGSSMGITALPLIGTDSGADQEIVSSTGWLTADDSTLTSVTSHAQTRTEPIALFRTSYAPDGVVRIVLQSASLTCKDGTGEAVTADWDAIVDIKVPDTDTDLLPDPVTGAPDGYQRYRVKPGGNALPAPGAFFVDGSTPLSTFITSWEGRTSAASTVELAATEARTADLPAVVSLATPPTRAGIASSAVNLTLGSLSCYAEDNQ